jgi:hypothetical protein
MVLTHDSDHLIEHRRRQEQVDEIGIELGPPTTHQLFRRLVCPARRSIPTSVRDRVEGVGNRDDSCRERDGVAAKASRVAGSVPPLVV